MSSHKCFALLMVFGVAGIAHAAADGAQLSRGEMSEDQSVVLRLPVEPGAVARPPVVAGLQFSNAGQSSEFESINGAVSQHTFALYRVTADHAGAFDIPVAGQTLHLQVRGAGTAAGAQNNSAPSRANAHVDPSLAFLRVTMPQRKLYVGESALATFKAYFRGGTEVTLTGLPSFETSMLTVSQVSDTPHQSTEMIGGVPYRVASWTAKISAATSGHFSGAATLPVIIRYREAPAARPNMPDPFSAFGDDDDPFPSSSALLQQFMNGNGFGNMGGFGDVFGTVRQRDMTLRAPAQTFEVAPLPENGRPKDFAGAVGDFDVHAALNATHGTAFEPLTLTINVSGRGNFDRVTPPGATSNSDWKSYPGTVKFTASAGSQGLSGTKTEEQAIVPQHAGATTLPPISFSFFNPDRGVYVTRSTAPIAVDVAKSEGAASSNAANAVATVSAPQGNTLTENAVPAADRVAEGAPLTTLWPPYMQAWFWLMQAVLLAAFAVAIGYWWRQQRASKNADNRAANTALARDTALMHTEAARGDALGFLAACTNVARAVLAEKFGVRGDTITAAEAERYVGESGPHLIRALKVAEAVRYGGRPPARENLVQWDSEIARELSALRTTTQTEVRS